MRHFLPALAILLLLGPSHLADGQEPGFYENGKWQDGQKAAAEAKLVIRGKIVEAGKATGKGWDGNYDKSNLSHYNRTCKIDMAQEVVVEIEEVLLGKLGEETKKLTVKMSSASLNYQAVYQYYYRLMRKKNPRGLRSRKREVPVDIFALKKGESCIFYLDTPKTETKGKEKFTNAAHLSKNPPMSKPDNDLLRSVRAFCAEMKLWRKPPKLPDDQEKTAAKLIADLGAEDFELREKADKALRAIGARLKPQLDKAATDRDEERSFRARAILEAVKPEPGKAEFPRGGRARRLPATFKKRPEPKPEPEPAPEPAPLPEVEGGNDRQ